LLHPAESSVRGHVAEHVDLRGDNSSPESWTIAVVIVLGHAAGQEVAAGRMSPEDAGAACRDGVMRFVLKRPVGGSG
jgi:hypothetical protein